MPPKSSNDIKPKTKRSVKPKEDPATAVENFMKEVYNIKDKYSELKSEFNELRTKFTDFNSTLINFEKLASKTIKTVQKSKRRNINISPAGFNKAMKMSPELASFLDRPKDSEISRPELTHCLSVYIKEHGLQDPTDGRIIIPNEKLKNLLRIEEDTHITYFKLQKYYDHLFIKNT